MKKTITLLLTLCLLLCLLPTEAVAYLGDIQTVDSGTVTAKKLNSGSWELRNDYLRVIVRKDGTLSTAPAADSAIIRDAWNWHSANPNGYASEKVKQG